MTWFPIFRGAVALPPLLGLRAGRGLSAAALRRLQAPRPRGNGTVLGLQWPVKGESAG